MTIMFYINLCTMKCKDWYPWDPYLDPKGPGVRGVHIHRDPGINKAMRRYTWGWYRGGVGPSGSGKLWEVVHLRQEFYQGAVRQGFTL